MVSQVCGSQIFIDIVDNDPKITDINHIPKSLHNVFEERLLTQSPIF